MTGTMQMPKTAMDENHLPTTFENEIRGSWKIAYMEAVPKAHPMN
jgi:hypothetical protein